MGVTVQYASRVAGLPTPARLKRWAKAAAAADAQLNIRIVNAAEGRTLNGEFRGRDYATNVLTFPYGGKPPEADIVLCAQVVAREAREQGKALEAHYAHLVVHGVLHAHGHDHEKAAEAKRMEALEVKILRGLGYANPYE
ncbi:MAG: ybeY [Betaproteobacteria bacterium]|nr:ybeY [Betaproteobacteria bacterium]